MLQWGYVVGRIDVSDPQNIDYHPPFRSANDPDVLFSDVSVAYEVYASPRAKAFPTRGAELSYPDDAFSAPGDVLFEHASLSGVPIGSDVWATRANRSFKIRLRTPWMRADVSLQPDFQKGFPKNPETIVEGAARLTVGLVESRRLLVSTRRTLSGTALSSYQTDAALTFGDLTAWASLRGWTAKLDDDRQVETLTKGTHTLVIPLGAQAVKIDGAWRELPDVTMLKDGRWWVPLDALEAAAKT